VYIYLPNWGDFFNLTYFHKNIYCYLSKQPAGVFLFPNFTHMKFINYLRDTRAELRHVTWPTRNEAINYTIIVIAISVGTGVFLGLLDFVLQKGIASLI